MTTIITFSFSNTYTENLTTFLYINWQVFTYSHLHSPLILLFYLLLIICHISICQICFLYFVFFFYEKV